MYNNIALFKYKISHLDHVEIFFIHFFFNIVMYFKMTRFLKIMFFQVGFFQSSITTLQPLGRSLLTKDQQPKTTIMTKWIGLLPPSFSSN